MVVRVRPTRRGGRPRSRALLSVILSVGLASALSSCVTLDKGSEANVPTVTCILVFGDGCRFDNEDDDRTMQVKKEGDMEIVEKTRKKAFPPVGQHAVP